MGELAEQLRLILEPTQASRLAGDYRTGKRINMKKVRACVVIHACVAVLQRGKGAPVLGWRPPHLVQDVCPHAFCYPS